MRSPNTETGQPCRRDRKECHVINHRSSCINPSGFTLIELLVVISVIAVLMAVLLPALSRARKQARAIICQSRLRQWGMALAAYTETNQGRFPSAMGVGFDGIWLLRGAFLSGKDPNDPQDSLHRFHTRDIACCPAATQPSANRKFGTLNYIGGGGVGGFASSFPVYRISGSAGSAFTAWEITTPGPPFRGSYGLNQWLSKGFNESMMARLGMNLDVLSLRGRAKIPVLLDAVSPGAAPTGWDGPMTPDGGSGFLLMANFVTNRHGDFANALFLDWSVRKVGLKELWTLYWCREFNPAGQWTKAGGVTPDKWPAWMRNMKDY
ncbi:MAG TPA: type II secretion system protein [Sedimentisphaerales bacterium]|nr:type II secretion system protein [Sedimentisphaerales bacterium]